jgi:hypothetical protein
MKSRVVTALSLAVAGVAAAVGLAAPAQAGAPGYVQQGTYGWPDQCQGIGYYGQQNHQWQQYYCETVVPTNWTAPGQYRLWVRY